MTRMPMDTLVQLSDVTKQYEDDKRPAVAQVTLDVGAGESVALMGPSGSGKSTLLNLIAGLDRPTSGTVRVGDQQVGALSEAGAARFRRSKVGIIFQVFNLLDDMTVADNVLLPAELAGMPAGRARARLDELLAALRIEDHRNAYPARLSGGERQRVAIARALMNKPRVLFADEPTGNLDFDTGRQIMSVLEQLHQQNGQTIVMVTHDRSLAQQANRVLVLEGGKLNTASRST
jgi:putative ABC transport system ATP-binding protein